MWECHCDCGGISYVPISDLKLKKVYSCGCVRSKGEEIIAQLLSEAKIKFEKQKHFPTCYFKESGYFALFDFYVDDKYLIEFDGIQHFKPLGGWSTEETVKNTQKHDKVKNEWCK